MDNTIRHSKSSSLYVTSDLHFFHANCALYTGRPWTDLDAMTEAIVENWNSVVPEDGIVYIVGDVALGGKSRAQELADVLGRLNGDLFLVPGNHDTYILDKDGPCLQSGRITLLPPLVELAVKDKDAYHGVQSITLCHYAMRHFNGSHKGAIQLFGHSHGNEAPYGRTVDIGFDAKWITGTSHYKPYSYEQIKTFMSTRTTPVTDHHGT